MCLAPSSVDGTQVLMQTPPSPVSPVGILLVNLGTPDSPSVSDVRRYLREFLSDPRVLTMAPLGRWMLLNLVILPFRPKKTAEAYSKIWRDDVESLREDRYVLPPRIPEFRPSMEKEERRAITFTHIMHFQVRKRHMIVFPSGHCLHL